MKKLIYIFLFAVMFSACTQASLSVVGGSSSEDEDPQTDYVQGISFWEELSSYVGSTTKGLVVENNFEAGATFGVSAYELKDGIWDSTDDTPDGGEVPNTLYNMNVELQDDGTWFYSPVASWPKGDVAKVRFFAYYPHSDSGFANGENEGGYPTLNIPEIGISPTGHVDYMVAQTDLLDNSVSNSVVLTFDHVLTQVDFMVNYITESSDGVFVDVSDWTIKLFGISVSGVGAHTGVGRFGDYGFTWDFDSNPELVTYNLVATAGHLVGDMVYANGANDNHVRATTAAGVLLLQPQMLAADQVTVEFTVEIDKNDGSEIEYFSQSVVAGAHEYVLGRRVVYTFTVNPLVGDDYDPFVDGDIDVDVSDWEGDDVNSNDTNLGTQLEDGGNGDMLVDDWVGGGGNSNDFGDGLVDGNTGDLEGDGYDENDHENNLGSGMPEGDLELDTDEWNPGGGNSNDFGDGLIDGNTGDLEGENGWEGDKDNDTNLDGGNAGADGDINTDDWKPGGGNSNDFGDGLIDGNTGDLEGENGWEGDKDNDTNLGGGNTGADGDINTDEWNPGGGNSNDFGNGLVDGNTGDLEGENGWDDDKDNDTNLGGGNAGADGNLDTGDWKPGGGNSNDFGNDLVDGNIGDLEGENGWGEGNGNSNDLEGEGSASGGDMNNEDWYEGGGNSNDFTSDLVEGNVGDIEVEGGYEENDNVVGDPDWGGSNGNDTTLGGGNSNSGSNN